MAQHILGRQSLRKFAIVKSFATPANPGADAHSARGPGGLARDQFAADGSQPAKEGVAQPVAQKLAASGAGIWKMSVHVSAILMNLLHSAETGLPSFVQALTFLARLIAAARRTKRPNKRGA
jgi:hypothetical protein